MIRFVFSLILLCLTQISSAAQTCTTSKIGGSNDDFKGISGSANNNVIAVGKKGVSYTYNGSSWTSSNTGTNKDLEDVFVLNSSAAYAVGDDGTVRIYNGTSWSGSSTGTSEDLRSVWAYSSSEVFVVGKDGVILRYNGTSWSDLSSAANTGSTDLNAAWGNSTNFYALGKNGNLYVYNRSGDSWSTITTCASAIGDDANGIWGDSSGNIYMAVDGGAVYKYDGSNCSQVATGSEDLDGIFGSDTTGEIYAVGKDGEIVYYNGTSWTSTSEGSEDINDVWLSSSGNAFYAIDKGYTSTCTYSSSGGGGGSSSCSTTTTASKKDLDGITGSSKTDVLGVGKDGEVWSYNGTNWSAVTVSGNPDKDLEDVFAIDSTNSVAVGDDGTVLLENNGTWSTLTAPTSEDLKGVWAYSSSEIYVFGKKGSVYSYNGTSWTDQRSAAGTNNPDDFEDAWGNATYVYGLTDKGNIFRFNRGTSSWNEITTCNVGGGVDYEDLWGDASNNIYLAGDKGDNGVVYKYDGATCTQVATASDDLKGIYGSTSSGDIYASGKNGYILHYNGSSWTQSKQGSEDFNDVWVASDGTPFYSGDGGTLTSCSTTPSFDHIRITHDGNALTCEPESITLTACADSSCSSNYTSDVSVTLTPTGWVGGDTQTITGGSSTFKLSKTTAGSYTLGVSSSSPSASNSIQCNSGGGGTSCNITYYNSGFIYDVPNLTSCATSANVTVSAVRLDDTSQACIPTFQNKTKTINFWSTYSSPSTGNTQVVLNNGSANTTIATSSPGTGINLAFNASGQANMTVTYDNAGRLNLTSRYTNGSLTMTGSDSFVTTPAKLYVYSDDTNADCAANNATCSAFTSAGSNFNLKVRAACANNVITDNFILNNIALTHTNTAPNIAQGSIGTSSFNIADANNGENNAITQTVTEVGVFTFTATSPAYLGTTGPSGTSTYIGRFTPGQFCVSATNLTNRTDSNSKTACTDNFSYLSEDFTNTFTLTAQRSGASCGDGSSTANYTASFSKFDTTNLLSGDNTTDASETGVLNFAAIDSASSTNLSGSLNFNIAASTSSGQFTNGSLSVTAKMDITRSGSSPNYIAVSPYSDVDIGIKPVDTDNIALASTNLTINSANYYNIGETLLYFGRLYADNSFGSEQEGLTMWAEPQYCDSQNSGVCTVWKTKADDTCSLFSVSAPTDTIIGETSGGTNGYWVSGSDYSASSGVMHTTDSHGRKAGWLAWYTAGGTGGTYNIPFVTHPYLVSQNGSASFGLYRGDDRIIYWREIFE